MLGLGRGVGEIDHHAGAVALGHQSAAKVRHAVMARGVGRRIDPVERFAVRQSVRMRTPAAYQTLSGESASRRDRPRSGTEMTEATLPARRAAAMSEGPAGGPEDIGMDFLDVEPDGDLLERESPGRPQPRSAR